jgi:hypothetical protein
MAITDIAVNTKLASIHVSQSDVLSEQDLAAVQSVSGHNKIVQAFEKTPFEFRFVFAPNWNPDQTAAYSARLHEEQKRVAPNSITVMYTNNFTSERNYMPFTAWIMAHRIGHINLKNHGVYSNQRVFTAFREFAIALNMGSMFGCGYPVSHSCADDAPGLRYLAMFLLTTRAARNGNILLPADSFGEIVAQFIITGGVKLLRADQLLERIEMLSGPEPTKHEYMTSLALHYLGEGLRRSISRIGKERVQVLIDALAAEVNMGVHDYLQSMVGKVVWF